MKKFIKISSQGEIDVMAFILVGASSKRADNSKIGFFGSGLKYSLAYLLRNKINFKVFSGYREINIETKSVNFRENNFEQIVVNGQESSLTTDMGMDWEPWFIIREIYCNAIDEGDHSIEIIEECMVLPVEDTTVFYIEVNEDFRKIVDDWEKYFSENRKDLVFNADKFKAKVFAGGTELIIYRKGIRCYHEKDCKSLFSYDLYDIEINESRLVKYMWQLRDKVCFILSASDCARSINILLSQVTKSFEGNLPWTTYFNNFKDLWLECIQGRILVPYESAGYFTEEMEENRDLYLVIPANLVEALQSRFGEAVKVAGQMPGKKTDGQFKYLPEKNPRQEYHLKLAVEFLQKAGYTVRYPIELVQFFDDEVLGQAFTDKDAKVILLSEKLFDHGAKKIVEVIIEENEHHHTGFSDETRQFQNRLFQLLVSSYEEKTGVYL